MSTATLTEESNTEAAEPRRGMVRALVAVIAVALLAVALAAGYAWGHHERGSAASPGASSVDAGFARDMSTHHQQAVTMAAYTRDNTDDPAVRVLAYDIESSQEFQIGEMQGWLDGWGLPRQSDQAPMAWMAGHATLTTDGLMPGMATPAQMTKLQTLHGKALDIDFLQLMIHHHQGGVPMAQYGADHASSPYVRGLAQAIVAAQSSEIVSMEQMLRQRGASPLPAPTH
ncbi:MAG: hypothetical protein QOE97_1107 [Pseudonocardiales bacterium]|jgi:uncharacterized protein (DUF305 family)|nr:hypothetical protein [Pseudonocardiales bacterium]